MISFFNQLSPFILVYFVASICGLFFYLSDVTKEDGSIEGTVDTITIIVYAFLVMLILNPLIYFPVFLFKSSKNVFNNFRFHNIYVLVVNNLKNIKIKE